MFYSVKIIYNCSMSNLRFPDAILHHGGLMRVVTDDAVSWLHFNTNLSPPIPRIIKVYPEILEDMREDGLTVHDRSRQPLMLP
jgi:hypothetical protein